MIVTTQQELDAALAAGEGYIVIKSPRGVWLHIGNCDSATVRAYDSATVRAYGSATVEAYGSATVEAYGSATVEAYGSATVEAYGSATVEAYGSATVEAYGSATVEAYGSATVEAYGSATVRAYDSATVEAYGSATVRAYDSATVRAYDSATVRAYGSATVRASRCVAVHLFHATATITGGVVIDVTGRDNDGQSWCDYHGVDVTGGKAVLFKAVMDDWCTTRGPEWTYKPGATVTAEDFEPTRECGHGLHLCATPRQSRRYLQEATRFVAVEVDVETLVPLDAKTKAPTCRVLHEVDIDGEQVAA